MLKISDAEVIYGSSTTYVCPENDNRQLEVSYIINLTRTPIPHVPINGYIGNGT